MAEKIYCGNAKIVNTNFGDLLKGSMHRDDLNKVVAWMKKNNSDWFNFMVKEKRDKVEGKPTHYIELDEWRPAGNMTLPSEQQKPQDDDLPF